MNTKIGRACLVGFLVVLLSLAVSGRLEAEPAALAQPGAQGSVCYGPKLSPSLSYSLTGFHRGDLDRTCRSQLAAAQAKGFTTITLVPAIEYDATANRILPSSRTMNPGELTRCLEKIWDSCMNIVYQPHLDSTRTLGGVGEKDWRADFNFDPTNPQYYASMFQEFEVFLNTKRAEIARGDRQVDVVIAAELEKSTTAYPAQWRQFAQAMRDRLNGMRVRLGLNPNWHPRSHPGPGGCSDFRAFVREMDFVAPSFYGDWSGAIGHGSSWADVSSRKVGVLDALSRRGRPCEVPEFRSAAFAVGEFGTGSIFESAEHDSTPAPAAQADFVRKRRQLYQNLLDWAANDASLRANPPLALNIWTLGIFDPVNASQSRSAVSDSEIESLFVKYSSNRHGQNAAKATDTPLTISIDYVKEMLPPQKTASLPFFHQEKAQGDIVLHPREPGFYAGQGTLRRSGTSNTGAKHEDYHITTKPIDVGVSVKAQRFANHLLIWFEKYDLIELKSEGHMPKMERLFDSLAPGVRQKQDEKLDKTLGPNPWAMVLSFAPTARQPWALEFRSGETVTWRSDSFPVSSKTVVRLSGPSGETESLPCRSPCQSRWLLSMDERMAGTYVMPSGSVEIVGSKWEFSGSEGELGRRAAATVELIISAGDGRIWGEGELREAFSGRSASELGIGDGKLLVEGTVSANRINFRSCRVTSYSYKSLGILRSQVTSCDQSEESMSLKDGSESRHRAQQRHVGTLSIPGIMTQSGTHTSDGEVEFTWRLKKISDNR